MNAELLHAEAEFLAAGRTRRPRWVSNRETAITLGPPMKLRAAVSVPTLIRAS